jgi:methyl-accepting chemotaxis protein
MRSIASKFNILTIFLILLTVFLTGSSTIWQHQISYFKKFTEHGKEIAVMLSKNLIYGVYAKNQEAIAQSLQSLEENKDIAYILVYDKQGVVLTQKNQDNLGKLPLLSDRNALIQHTETNEYTAPNGKRYINIITPVFIRSGLPVISLKSDFTTPVTQSNNPEIIGYVQLGISQNSIYKSSRQFLLQTLMVAPVTIILGIFLTLWQTRRITQPIKKLVKATHEIAKGDFGRELEIYSQTDEIAELAHSFNKMSEELALYQKQVSAHTDYLEEEVVQGKQDLKQKNSELQMEKEKKEEAEKAVHEKEKEMLSFFTHTMRNALATAPESLRQAIQLLGGEDYEKDTKHYQAINKIAGLFSTLSLTDCLIDTYKQSISDPQEFKQSWQIDIVGEATPEWVIASAIKQALNRIIFMSDTTELRKLLNHPETSAIKAVRKSFIEDVLPLNIDRHGIDVFFGWVLGHIPALELSLADCDELNFGVNQVRFSLLFAISSELILNALKYWDGTGQVYISWGLDVQQGYVFSVQNHCKANATSHLAGTHKGLAFIKRLVELLGENARFNCTSEDQLFKAELILNKALFEGES